MLSDGLDLTGHPVFALQREGAAWERARTAGGGISGTPMVISSPSLAKEAGH